MMRLRGGTDLEGGGSRVGQQVHEHGLANSHTTVHVQPLQLNLLCLGWRACHQPREPAKHRGGGGIAIKSVIQMP